MTHFYLLSTGSGIDKSPSPVPILANFATLPDSAPHDITQVLKLTVVCS